MDYDIHMDVKYAPLDIVDAAKLADECTERWWNQSLCKVNDSVVRLGVFLGEFHFHKHDREDELFFVLEVGCSSISKKEKVDRLAPWSSARGKASSFRRASSIERALVSARSY